MPTDAPRSLPEWVEQLIEKWSDLADQKTALARANGHDHPKLATFLLTEAERLKSCADDLVASWSLPREEPWEQRARTGLWLTHGCPYHALYGDDGEMQCNNGARHGLLDFKRDPWYTLYRSVTDAQLRERVAVLDGAAPVSPEEP